MKPTVLGIAVAVTAWTLSGCGTPGAVAGGNVTLPATNSAEYLDKISSQPTVTEAQALEGIMLLLDQQQKLTFAECVKLLKDRHIVSSQWDFRADRPMTRGKVAYMIYQACGMKGGLTLTLTGPSQRYCLRELQYRGMMAPGLPYNPVTGMEYVAILARADELRRTGRVSPVMLQEGLSR